MRIGTPDDGNAPRSTTQRVAYDLLADGFGSGFNGPIQVVVADPDGSRSGRRRAGASRTRRRSGCRRRHRSGVQRRAGHGADHGEPDHGAAGRAHGRARPPPPQRRAARRSRRHGCDDAADRPGDGDGPHRADHEPAPMVHRGDRGDVVRAADDRVPLDPRAAEGGADEPAVDRRRLRRDRRRVPVGLGQRADRRRAHDADQPVRTADDVRDPVRAVDGLRGVPARQGA